MTGPRRLTGLGARVLTALIVVLCVAVVTAWVVALAVGPAIFEHHMEMVETSHHNPEVIAHAEEAFDAAWKLSLLLALVAALATSIIVTVFLVNRLTRPIRRVRRAVVKITEGDYTARVPESTLGVEFSELMAAFNSMAAELDRTELTRKRLLSDLAHELRTPVATVDGYLEAMQDGVSHADEDTLIMLRGQTERLTRLAEDISLVSAAEERHLDLRYAAVHVGDILAAAVAQVRGRGQDHGVKLGLEADDRTKAVTVTIDGDRIGQVLTNLLDNALHHTEPGDQVTLSAWSSQGSVILAVTDTGHGIEAEHLPHIFERFYRADSARDRNHGGSGIGLALARSIVSAHGGSVWAHSDGPDQGATFTVELPQRPKDSMKVQ
ncbi:sensor histidine kinase [Nesterenkonia sp. HG001]|uniref:sensor histidine kinase n=1 Tax=Nesterenkonia sp. HG001 TaxID=2983207 RepID=UPI002AC3C8F4|nr:ATP-binding protein [Nesterenkonia sp. HG001]MDZ5077829.1 ATP-binding protein [Nesterenkonia sp. HG001]